MNEGYALKAVPFTNADFFRRRFRPAGTPEFKSLIQILQQGCSW